jgi:hypothetical protein
MLRRFQHPSIARRKFFFGLLAAPAIVHAGNLMPIKPFVKNTLLILPGGVVPGTITVGLPDGGWREYYRATLAQRREADKALGCLTC